MRVRREYVVRDVKRVSHLVLQRWIGLNNKQLRIQRKNGRAVATKGRVAVYKALSRAMIRLEQDDAAKVSDLIRTLKEQTHKGHPLWKDGMTGWQLYDPITRRPVDGNVKLRTLQNGFRPTRLTRNDRELVDDYREALEDCDFHEVLDDVEELEEFDFHLAALALVEQYAEWVNGDGGMSNDNFEKLIGTLKDQQSKKFQ